MKKKKTLSTPWYSLKGAGGRNRRRKPIPRSGQPFPRACVYPPGLRNINIHITSPSIKNQGGGRGPDNYLGGDFCWTAREHVCGRVGIWTRTLLYKRTGITPGVPHLEETVLRLFSP